MRAAILLLILLSQVSALSAQYTQRIRGRVTDQESLSPLQGVVISVVSLASKPGAVTNEQGAFSIPDLPLGKLDLLVSYPGYETQTIREVLLTSGKELVLDISLVEAVRQIEEVEVRARREVVNEMAVVGARRFDVQETERYAGSRGDPARMASNFAGVQGADDSRNDIIIRGNSPQGLLWRLEDLDIPNPNHFAVPGTTGGPVSILNNRTLGNSDFFTSAFPAGYGNSTAGVFDLQLRNGNNQRYEGSFQFGILGTEVLAEGPVSRKHGSSFLVTYRYATLKIFEGLNIKIGTNSVPSYQDASFKLHFPVGKKGSLSLFGIGGLSNIDLVVSKLTEPPDELYGESDRDQYFYSNTGVAGLSYGHTINASTYAKLTVGHTVNVIGAQHDKVFRSPQYTVDSLKDILGYRFRTGSTVVHGYLNRKLGSRHTIRLGIINQLYQLRYIDSSRQFPPTRQDWQHRIGFEGNTNLLQGYIQYKYRPLDWMTLTAGIHAGYLSHSNSKALEPRLGLRMLAGKAGIITLGYGLHSQMQPLYWYFAHLPERTASEQHNRELDLTRSHHLVGGIERALSNTQRMKLEAYYQHLFDVPIELRPGSSFSGVNQGASFNRLFPDTLANEGTARNMGLELTLHRRFSRGYYFMFTGTVFDSKAKGRDGVLRHTDYNGHYAVNLLGGYEKKLGRNSTLITGLKLTYAGGRRYSPPDVAASNTQGDFVAIENLRNTLQYPDYFRADLKLGFRINGRRLTHELAIDLVNIAGTRNVLALTYNTDLAAQGQYPFVREYQLGFLPLFYYRLDLSFRPAEP